MNKRGSHVGIVLSFVIFVTFLIFLYSILEPQLKVERDKQAFIEYLKNNLIENFYDKLTIVVTKSAGELNIVLEEDPKDCMSIVVSSLDVGKNCLVKYEEDLVDASCGSSLIIKWDGYPTSVYKAYFADEEFAGDYSFSNGECIQGEIKLVNEKDYIFETIINESVSIYNTKGFAELADKFELNIPPGNEFGFKFLDKDRNLLYETNEGELSVSIFSEEIPVQYVDEEANIKPGFLVIRVW